MYKININYQLGYELFYWRTKNKDEVDFIIQHNDHYLFIESKVSAQSIKKLESNYEIQKVFKDKKIHQIQVNQAGDRILGNKVPISRLKDYILGWANEP